MNSNKKEPIKPVGIIPGLNKIHVKDEPIVTPSLSLSDLKRKPRRSMLGRRRPSLPASQADDKLISVCPQPSTSSSATIFDTAKPRWSTSRKAPVTKLPVNYPRLTLSSSSGNIFNVPKPRKSTLGRKNLTGNTKSEVSSFLKPVGTRSPKFKMCSSTPVAGHDNPFEDQDLDSSPFFNGQSDFSTWSIFKNSDQYYPVEKKKTRPIFRQLVFDTKPEPSQKEVKSETSLGVEPSPSIESKHGCSFQCMINEENCKEESDTEANLNVNMTEPEQKSENTVVENFPKEELKLSSGKKKFSLTIEEDDEGVTAIFAPAINEEPPVTPPDSIQPPPLHIKDLLNKWNTLYMQWKSTCEEMESVGKEITERLQFIELESKNANHSTDEANKENAPHRQMFNNYKSQFAFIQTPKNVKESKPSTSACYTPNA